MKIDERGDGVRIELTGVEVRLMRHALERASFIDTPVSVQADVAAFCARILEALPASTR